MIKLHLSILRVLLNEKKRISDAIAGAVFDHGRRMLIFIAPNRILKELRRPILDPPTSSNAERCGGIDIGFCNSAYNIFTH
ncbi:hypothetical protein C5167_010640 [Papaver somniferum]|uniref:Uncharacterized protein n=1 Tax=Papaver somniferum TaxID=3469 RepID=A0A4Y7K3X2_PAPSO|nr:hypothetical protein C5167_010640 [Papaver somniferum]